MAIGSVVRSIQKAHPDFKVTALVRSEKDFSVVQACGIEVVHGTHQDLDLIRKSCANADIVLNTADADDLNLTNAVLQGLKDRKSKSILIHTSGTGVVTDKTEGQFTDYAKKIWDDSSVDDIKSIPENQPHRNVDLRIFESDGKDGLSCYIIAPSCIYGAGIGPVHRISQQIPGLIRTALENKQAVRIGPGKNMWNNVHIVDLVQLYLIVLGSALSSAKPSLPYEKFYWGSAREHVWGEIVNKMALTLYERGLIETTIVKEVSIQEYPMHTFTGNNSRTVANRGFALGWKPVMPTAENTLIEDIDLVLGARS